MLHKPDCPCTPCRENPPGTHFMLLGEGEWHTVGEKDDAMSSSVNRTGETATTAEAEHRSEEMTPPDPYAAGLAKLRAANATDLSRFEDRWKAERFAALQAEYAAMDEHLPANPTPRLTAAELADYRASDPYRAGLDKLRSETVRDRERRLAGPRVKQ